MRCGVPDKPQTPNTHIASRAGSCKKSIAGKAASYKENSDWVDGRTASRGENTARIGPGKTLTCATECVGSNTPILSLTAGVYRAK